MTIATTPPPVANSLTEFTVRTIDVKRTYKMGTDEVHALRGVTVSINRGEYLSLMGPSGSGKSTLFNMIGGLDKPTTGNVFIDEARTAQLYPHELAYLRCRRIGYIFQPFNLLTHMTALDNVTLPIIFAGVNAE